MKKRVLITLCLFVTLTIVCKAQEIGKIYPKSEAKAKFGPVIDSVAFSVSDLKKILDGTEKYAMFKVSKGTVKILGDGRKILHPKDARVDSTEAFCLCSKSKILELLNTSNANTKTNADTLSIEMHQLYFTITYGDVTLEDVVVCPPFCL